MPLIVKDRVKETSTTTGTGTLTLAGAAVGFETFSASIGNANTTYYAIVGGAEFEVGLGTVAAGTLARTTVLQSSNADALVNFSAGSKDVFCTYPADKAVYLDGSGNVGALGTITSGVGTNLTGVAKLTTNAFTGAQKGGVTALTSTAAAMAINLATNNNFSHTTSENTTLSAPSNPVAGQSGVINITQGAIARTLAYNTFYKFAGGTVPTLTSSTSAVTFTDTGDTVGLTAHGLSNGDTVAFATIVTTTGISINVIYFVVGATANTFQVALTSGGAAIALTTNGTGTLYLKTVDTFVYYVISATSATCQLIKDVK